MIVFWIFQAYRDWKCTSYTFGKLGWAGLGWAVGSRIEEKRSRDISHVFVIFLFIIEYKYSKKL